VVAGAAPLKAATGYTKKNFSTSVGRPAFLKKNGRAASFSGYADRF
jgi:hypothetical protein